MDHLLKSIDNSLAIGNWDAALMVALCLPDICGKLDGLKSTSTTHRYVKWAQKWLEPLFTREARPDDFDERMNEFKKRLLVINIEMTKINQDEVDERELKSRIAEMKIISREKEEYQRTCRKKIVKPTARDIYAFRCAFCHSGEHSLAGHKAKETLDSFIVVSPSNDNVLTGTTNSVVMHIMVDEFCRTISAGVSNWLSQRLSDEQVLKNMADMPKIRSVADIYFNTAPNGQTN